MALPAANSSPASSSVRKVKETSLELAGLRLPLLASNWSRCSFSDMGKVTVAFLVTAMGARERPQSRYVTPPGHTHTGRQLTSVHWPAPQSWVRHSVPEMGQEARMPALVRKEVCRFSGCPFTERDLTQPTKSSAWTWSSLSSLSRNLKGPALGARSASVGSRRVTRVPPGLQIIKIENIICRASLTFILCLT